MRPPILLLFSLSLASHPAQSVWIRSTGTAGALRPDVHSVESTEREVIVRSAGLSLAWLGPLGQAASAPAGPRQYEFRIPLRPRAEVGAHAHIPASHAGVFVNGVPIHSQFEGSSYREQNLWHFDPLARGAADVHGVSRPGLLESLAASPSAHSPLIGFALDGFPVYGPWSGGKRMRSSYRLRRITTRERWADGTRLVPGQEGPPVNEEYPLGTFVEDYEYVPGAGDLDQFNGRFTQTPEYPGGTYAYFLASEDTGRPAFPYLFAHEFYGHYGSGPAGAFSARQDGVEFDGREPGRLRFRVTGSDGRPLRHLESVHERPMHVFVVSRDRATFAHIHPEVDAFGMWEVEYTAPRAGVYRVFADVTPPGGRQRMAAFDWITAGAGGGVTPPQAAEGSVVLLTRGPIRSGEDVELQFRVNQQARNWQPFLGAWAHIVIAGEGVDTLIHAHPAEPARTGGEHLHVSGPPPEVVRVAVNFAAPGLHKVWFQTQMDGNVETISFPIAVLPGDVKKSATGAPAGALPVRITPGGFDPMRLEVPADQPLRLALLRSSESNCGGKIVFPALGITTEIRPGGMTLLDLPPQPSGEIRFTCGMGMYRGSVVAVSAPVPRAPQKSHSASGSPTIHKP